VLSPGVPTEWFKKSKARRELKKRIAIQKIPRVWRVVESIPRNTMGKGAFVCVLCNRSKMRLTFENYSQQEDTYQ